MALIRSLPLDPRSQASGAIITRMRKQWKPGALLTPNEARRALAPIIQLQCVPLIGFVPCYMYMLHCTCVTKHNDEQDQSLWMGGVSIVSQVSAHLSGKGL